MSVKDPSCARQLHHRLSSPLLRLRNSSGSMQGGHVLEMLQASRFRNGKWNVKAAHLQQGGGMSLISFSLTAGRLRDRQWGSKRVA